MANDAKITRRAHIPENLQGRDAAETGQDDTIGTMTMEQLNRQQDSLLQSVGAFRYTLRRMELLDGYRRLFRDLVADLRVVVDAHGPKPLVKRIDKALKETEES